MANWSFNNHTQVAIVFLEYRDCSGTFAEDCEARVATRSCGSEFQLTLIESYFFSGQFKWRCRNANVPLPLIVCGPLKNSISALSPIPSFE